MPFHFNAKKRIKGKKRFSLLFSKNNRIGIYPFQLVHLSEKSASGKYNAEIAVSVTKKRFKKAHEPNLLKRRMREAIRLHLPNFEKYLAEKKIKCSILFIYNTNDILPFKIIEDKIMLSLQRLKEVYA